MRSFHAPGYGWRVHMSWLLLPVLLFAFEPGPGDQSVARDRMASKETQLLS